MKKLLALVAITLSACNNYVPSQPSTIGYVLPPELKDCTIHRIDAASHPYLYITRCSGSVTTQWTTGSKQKTTHATTVIIDGVEYEAKK